MKRTLTQVVVEDFENEEAATDFIEKLGKQYCAGTLAEEDVKCRQRELVSELARKRPAGAFKKPAVD